MTAHTPIFIRPVQVKELFGIHRATLYRWAAAGHIKIHKRGAASFVSVSEVTDFITGSLGDQLGDCKEESENSPLLSGCGGAGRGT
ncbi:MAG: helix-turn-helix domain-containing protein [Paracoccus sp. (in: a-proteobacteria)]|nr:helix-turn-helix domain-containing protein [Paracoccus sp. (in: a-proteobacteria)]